MSEPGLDDFLTKIYEPRNAVTYNVALFHTMNLSERVYLITGGASGLGEAAVRRLHSRGAAVSILDRSEERAKVRLYKFNIPIFLLEKF